MSHPILIPFDEGALTQIHTWTAEQTFTGQMVEDRFVSQLHSIVGGADTMRLLWMPKLGDQGSATTLDKDARTITWDATVASRLSRLGSGHAQDFDGTDDEGDITTTAHILDYNFGDGATDEPFSVVMLVKPDAPGTGTTTLVEKGNSAAAQEWEWDVQSSSGYMRFGLHDEDATAVLERLDNASIGTDWTVIGFTYDGSAALPGMALYKNGARRTSTTTNTSGTYIAMENKAGILNIAARYSTKAQFFNGNIALVMVVAKQLQADEIWAIKELVNSFFDLSL